MRCVDRFCYSDCGNQGAASPLGRTKDIKPLKQRSMSIYCCNINRVFNGIYRQVIWEFPLTRHQIYFVINIGYLQAFSCQKINMLLCNDLFILFSKIEKTKTLSQYLSINLYVPLSGMRFFKKGAANSLFNRISLLFVGQMVNEMACFRQNRFDLIFSSFEVQCGSF